MKNSGLVACAECDALQRMVALAPGGVAECQCCGAELYREHRDSLDRTLALLLAAALVFAYANLAPVFELDAQCICKSDIRIGIMCNEAHVERAQHMKKIGRDIA